jgi:hypothetical protein
MKKALSTFILSFTLLTAFAQYKMRPVEELINNTDPGWPVVKQWIDSAKNKIEVLPADPARAKDALYKTQVTTRSIMGAIVYSTGGILVDDGWIRIFGSGSPRMQRTLPDWNKGKAFKEFGDRPAFFIVAEDAAGGLFAINYGSFGTDKENIYYFSPDSLEWEPLGENYEDFVWFCFTSDLEKFYKGIRWHTWRKDVQAIGADQVFHIYPPLWSIEGKDIEKDDKKPVPADELYNFNLSILQQAKDKDKH